MRKRDPRAPATTHPFFAASGVSTSGTSTPSGGRSKASKATLTPSQQQQTHMGADFVAQDWQKVSLKDLEAAIDGEGGEEGEEEEVAWECVVCGKEGRSEGRWRDHERSRGHLREVQK